ncbi:MAG: hypothetical protein RLZZ628_98 [Bacteroidota bacterium]|jgi:uncharacterized protein YuzE
MIKKYRLNLILIFGINLLHAQNELVQVDSLCSLFKSKHVKDWCKVHTRSANEQSPLIGSFNAKLWQEPFSYILIPTLQMPEDTSEFRILNLEKNLRFNDVRMPIHLWAFNALGFYSGFYDNDPYKSVKDTLKLEDEILIYLSNNGGKRYKNITWAQCAHALKNLNADFIFRIDGIYHTYFYYKRKKMYVFEENTLKTYSLKAYQEKYASKGKSK